MDELKNILKASEIIPQRNKEQSTKSSTGKISENEKELRKDDGILIKEKIRIMKENIPKRFKSKTFSNFIKSRNPQALQDCREYAKNFLNNMDKGKGLFLTGPVGSGKTHLAAAINDYIARIYKRKRRLRIILITAIDLLSEIKYSYERDNTEEILKRYEKCDLLILDDLGIEKSTEWTHELFYKIIDTRYANLLPMIITTNLSETEIKNKLSERILSRIYEMCIGVKLKGKDYRMEKI